MLSVFVNSQCAINREKVEGSPLHLEHSTIAILPRPRREIRPDPAHYWQTPPHFFSILKSFFHSCWPQQLLTCEINKSYVLAVKHCINTQLDTCQLSRGKRRGSEWEGWGIRKYGCAKMVSFHSFWGVLVLGWTTSHSRGELPSARDSVEGHLGDIPWHHQNSREHPSVWLWAVNTKP